MATATFLSQVAQITPNLYLSGFLGASEASCKKHRISYIITVCKEIPKINLANIESLKLDVLDRPNEQLDRFFDFVADKIFDVERRNGNCLVHCVAGISRSASMIIAYLMKYRRLSLRDAYNLVKSKRTFIRPNLGFWSQLVEYERKLFGKTSIRMIPCSFGLIPDVYEHEFKDMIIPYTTTPALPTSSSSDGNDNYTSSSAIGSIGSLSNSVSSTASITLNNNQIRLPISPPQPQLYTLSQPVSPPKSAKQPPIAFTIHTSQIHAAAANRNKSAETYTTTYNSSYGTGYRR